MNANLFEIIYPSHAIVVTMDIKNKNKKLKNIKKGCEMKCRLYWKVSTSMCE